MPEAKAADQIAREPSLAEPQTSGKKKNGFPREQIFSCEQTD
jgi:hypothetical protein